MLGRVLDAAGFASEQNKPMAIMGFSFLRCFVVCLCLSLRAPICRRKKGVLAKGFRSSVTDRQ